jgi:hypothetical protein
MMTEYPEHEKLSKIKDCSQLLGEFLDWAHGQDLTLCWYDDGENDPDGEPVFAHERGWRPCRDNIETLLSKFYGIDLRKIEAEKDQMLNEIRRMNAEKK